MPVTNDSLATALIGRTVRNSAGETLGRIEDLVLDPSNGRILFAILSFAGLSIPNDRFVAVPWGKFGGLSPGRDYLLLDVEKNVLADAPWFERNRWPDTSDASGRSRVYNHYGY